MFFLVLSMAGALMMFGDSCITALVGYLDIHLCRIILSVNSQFGICYLIPSQEFSTRDCT